MKVTITKDDPQPERICLNCGNTYEGGNAKRQYCSDKCRTAYHRKTQTQTISQQKQTLLQQETTIQEITNSPIRRTESIRVRSPVWQLAKQAHTTKLEKYTILKIKLADLKNKAQGIKTGNKVAYIGATAGVALVLIWVGIRYDNRRTKRLGMAFIVIAVFSGAGLGLFGYWLWKQGYSYLLPKNKQLNEELTQLACESVNVENLLNAEEKEVDKLRQALDQLPEYLSDTIISVDEVRGPPNGN